MTDTGQTDLPAIFLHPGRDKRLAAGHPWAYANEVKMSPEAKAIPPGSLVRLHRVDGKPLGIGTFNAHALICFRRFDESRMVDVELVRERLVIAAAWRDRLFDQPFYRLIHGEADGLPGLVIDRFDDVFVLQSGTRGMDGLTPLVVEALVDAFSPRAIVARNDGQGRRTEQLDSRVEILAGSIDGPLGLSENAIRATADPLGGQKTGWFFDQRDNRAFAARLVPDGGTFLDAYCYGGGFGLAALGAGAAKACFIDSSKPALDLVQASVAANGFTERATTRSGDAFDALESLSAEGTSFDVVSCDPPAFAKSKKDVPAALKGYRKVARLGAKLVKRGGALILSSCSHHVDLDSFQRECAIGLRRAGRKGQLLRTGGAAPDHPVLADLPESAYLKCLAFRLD
ncbi:MAG: class I SAM-dependent rRNA methyltransferase [Magnetovibrionaceae bacterium]